MAVNIGETARPTAPNSGSNSIDCIFENTSANQISSHNHNNNSSTYNNRKELERSNDLFGRISSGRVGEQPASQSVVMVAVTNLVFETVF